MTEKRETILVVDDTPENIEILDGILSEDYNVKVANNGIMALKIAEKVMPDLILLDIMMPGINGFEVCERLKTNPITRKIPIIFVTAMGEEIDERKGLELGAVDYITKPISPSIVRVRVKNHLALYNQTITLEKMVNEKTKEIGDTRLEIIKRLGRAAEYKDNETGMHVIRMSNYSKIIALGMGFPENEADMLKDAAPMHDIGKIGVPDSILKKPGKLDAEEWILMKLHSGAGAEIIGEHNSQLLKIARIVASEHHEKWDGTGYPCGKKGTDISIYARIAAVADVFDALSSKRPYKEPWPIEKAVEFIRSESGKHFDPDVVEAFNKGLEEILKIESEYRE